MKRRDLGTTAVAASIGAAGLCLLTLYLNPRLLLFHEIGPLLLCLFLPWTLLGTATLAVVVLMAKVLRPWPRPLRALVTGRPFYVSSMQLVLAATAVLYWHNLLSYRHSIPVDSLRALALSAVVISGAAVALLAVALDVLLFPARSRGPAAALAVLAPALALAVPLALRPRPATPAPPIPVRLDDIAPARRLVVVGIDGLSPSDVVADGAHEGVPSLERLVRRGAFGSLATLRPTDGPALWTTVFTGRLPRDHGIQSFSTYHLAGSGSEWALLPKGALVGVLERTGLVSRRPVTSRSRRRRALWNVLDAFDIPAGLVRIWGTHPPETIHGFVVSPYFYVLRGDPTRAATTLHPPALLAEIEARAVGPGEVDAGLLRELAGMPAGAAPLEDPALRALAAQALAPDLTYARAAEVMRSAYEPPFFAISFQGYDVAGHAFYRYAHPEAFGDVSPEQARRYERILERYASLLGQWTADFSRGPRAGEILVVLSTHGLEPSPLWRRLLGALVGAPVLTASHAAGPPGFFLAVGDGIRPGATLRDASVLDVAPTLLYLMGLPVARDMEGRVLTEMLEEDFARAHPLTFIPSYEGLAVAPAPPPIPSDDLPPLPEDAG
jgi:predicted AlkP superfamily phosphohydrolase/phosphomutase